jgi:hypothetical protein
MSSISDCINDKRVQLVTVLMIKAHYGRVVILTMLIFIKTRAIIVYAVGKKKTILSFRTQMTFSLVAYSR